MKRLLAVILVIILSVGLFTGCGAKDNGKAAEAASTEPSPAPDTEVSADTAKTAEEVPGTELSTFMNNYMDSKSKGWESMTQKLEEEENGAYAVGMLAFAFTDLAVVEIVFFDGLTTQEGNVFKGQLMFTGIDAWKKVDGDIIEFGYDYIYKEDQNQNKKGDREVSTGKFDKKSGSLTYEHYKERDGKRVSRSVVEISKNSDTSYSSQIFFFNTGEGGGDNKLEGYFTWFEGENLASLYAEKENATVDFRHTSIFGQKNLKPEDMAKDMKINIKTSYLDGKATFEDLEQ